MIRRRELLAALGGAAAAWPVAVRAQQTAMPVIGFLNSQSPEGYAEPLRGLRQGLKESGYVEGENLAIEYRWGGNQMERLPELAAELVRRSVALIITTGGPSSALSAKAATPTIPIVFNIGDDPVRVGLVTSFARPGGNLTGVSFLGIELTAKRLELLRELVPRTARVAVLVNPADAHVVQATLRDTESGWSCDGSANPGLQRRYRPRDGDCIRKHGARPRRCPVRRAHPLLRRPTHPSGPEGRVPPDSRKLSAARFCRCRRTDELRCQPARCLSPGGPLCGAHTQGR